MIKSDDRYLVYKKEQQLITNAMGDYFNCLRSSGTKCSFTILVVLLNVKMAFALLWRGGLHQYQHEFGLVWFGWLVGFKLSWPRWPVWSNLSRAVCIVARRGSSAKQDPQLIIAHVRAALIRSSGGDNNMALLPKKHLNTRQFH